MTPRHLDLVRRLTVACVFSLPGLSSMAGSLSPAPAPTPSVEEALFEKLKGNLEAIDSRLDGVLGVAVKDLTTGRLLQIRGDVVFPQASSIKLALIYELYHQAAAAKIDLSSLRPLPKARVGGSGILPFFSEKAQLTVRDLAVLMMSLSDNAATNILVDEVSFAAVNARMDALGLPKTRFRRRMIDLAAARRGEENVSTPLEMARLIEAIRKGEGLPSALADDMRAVIAVPKQAESSFGSAIPESVKVLFKGGSLEGVRTATGAVSLDHRPYVVAVMTTALSDEADGEKAIREISRLAFETFSRLDKASPEGRLLGR